jgi:thiamine-phosphate pyrophosphorylase
LHLGADDAQLTAARKLLGVNKIIGVSCYNQLTLAQKAEANGADYIAFGACFCICDQTQCTNSTIKFVSSKQSEKYAYLLLLSAVSR